MLLCLGGCAWSESCTDWRCATGCTKCYDAAASACRREGGHDRYRFCNATLSVEERVADLLQRIPDETKPALLTARGRCWLRALAVRRPCDAATRARGPCL